jgi:hypothetical protein
MHVSAICEEIAKGVEGDRMCLSTASSKKSHAHDFRVVRIYIVSISLTGQMLVQAMPDEGYPVFTVTQ